MRPLVILFAHHAADDVTRVHFALLRHHNPGVPVVPIYDRAGVAPGFRPSLPGSIDVGAFPWAWGEPRHPLHNGDTFAYRWWLHARTAETDAERIALIEWDTLATTPLDQAFAATWDADVSGSVVVRDGDAPAWAWWPGVAHLPPAHRAGIMPSGVVLLSRRALDHLARETPRTLPDAHVEVRIASGAAAAGMSVVRVPGMEPAVHCQEGLIHLGDAPGVYHPVKRLGGIDGRCRAAHALGARLAGL